MGSGQRSTPGGEHRPVLLQEVLAVLAPAAGEVVVDCTIGWAGHAVELLRRVAPPGTETLAGPPTGLRPGRLVGFDLDPDNLPQARQRLETVALPFSLHHGNFASLPAVLAEENLVADCILADLGMSSMQVDDAGRGFSYVRDGPLDMRMDRSRGRTAAEVLATISEEDLCAALRAYGDEPAAERVAAAIIAARDREELRRTGDLARVLMESSQPEGKGSRWRLHPAPGKWDLHPAARTFQALRILVNRELANLEALLRVLPDCLRSGGRAAVISFHSGEDRLVKAAFRAGLQTRRYTRISPEPVRASEAEKRANPRARSAKLRWAVRP